MRAEMSSGLKQNDLTLALKPSVAPHRFASACVALRISSNYHLHSPSHAYRRLYIGDVIAELTNLSSGQRAAGSEQRVVSSELLQPIPDTGR